LTFLGTGTSVGVPVIGCDCEVCASPDPRNSRTRSSVVLDGPHGTLLVDSGPDLRMQALRENLRRVDAVLYTHAHLDHVAGFDELRAFCWHREGPLPLYANPGCLAALREMFGWAFSGQNTYRGYVKPDPRLVSGPFGIGGLRVTPLPVRHGSVETNGYRFDAAGMRSLAYLPDVKVIPESTYDLLESVDLMVVDALRPSPHETHFTIAEACEAVERVGAAEAWLTHLGHENDHANLEQSLPTGIRVAWDGLKLDLAAG
jgi:phosphoribosyl 1,2-cyclic phosphate phosphodiesterase